MEVDPGGDGGQPMCVVVGSASLAAWGTAACTQIGTLVRTHLPCQFLSPLAAVAAMITAVPSGTLGPSCWSAIASSNCCFTAFFVVVSSSYIPLESCAAFVCRTRRSVPNAHLATHLPTRGASGGYRHMFHEETLADLMLLHLFWCTAHYKTTEADPVRTTQQASVRGRPGGRHGDRSHALLPQETAPPPVTLN